MHLLVFLVLKCLFTTEQCYLNICIASLFAVCILQDLQLNTMSDERSRKNHADPRDSGNIDDTNTPVPQRKRQRLQEFEEDEQSVIDLLPLEQLRNQLLQQQLPVLSPMFRWEIQPKVPGQGQQQAPQVQLVTQQIFRNPQWNQLQIAPGSLQLQAVIQPPQQSPLPVDKQYNERKSLSPNSDLNGPTQEVPPNRDASPKKYSVTIAQHVPEIIKQAIRESKYVDLMKLLKENSLDEEGDVISYKVIPKKNGKREAIKVRHEIEEISVWVRAFTVYMVIYLEAFPENAAPLAEYINTIFKLNEGIKWFAVYRYDMDLRRKREKDPETSWVGIDVELHEKMRSRPCIPPVVTDNACRYYNGNSCRRPGCRFAHVCLYCGKRGHPVTRCTELKSTS